VGKSFLQLQGPRVFSPLKTTIGAGYTQGRSFQSVITYYLITYFLTQMYPFVRMAREIRAEIFSGDLLVFMARGVPHWAVWSGRFLATASAYVVLVAPLAMLLIVSFGQVAMTLQALLGFCFLLLIGMFIKGQLWYLVGISSFFTEDNTGTIRLYELAEQLLSGAVLPLFLFPDWFGNLARYPPFTYTLFVPVQALGQGQTWNALLAQAAVGIGWCIVLGWLIGLVTERGWRRFTAHGARKAGRSRCNPSGAV
jgi:ABC-2 type transport system permease protein